jgi:hypothetical protein
MAYRIFSISLRDPRSGEAELNEYLKQSEAVPVYAVFTNDQPARMVKTLATSKTALESIAGVGDARIAKYGPRFLDLLKTRSEGLDAASRPALWPDRRPREPSPGGPQGAEGKAIEGGYPGVRGPSRHEP